MKHHFLVTLLLLSTVTTAQKLKEKLNEKIATTSDKVNGVPPPTTSSVPADAHQLDMVEIFTTTPKVWYVTLKHDAPSELYFGPTTNAVSNVIRGEDGKVKTFNSTMTVNMPEYPQYWFNEWRDEQVFFIQNVGFILKAENRMLKSKEDVDKLLTHEDFFSRIICLNKEDAKAMTLAKAQEIIRNYFTATQPHVDAILAKRTTEKEQLFQQYSIKDKKVKSLSIECKQDILRYDETVEYIIVATLMDGTVIKAGGDEKGYWTDYDITISGMEGTEDWVLRNHFKATPTDVVTVTVKSKYDATKTAKKSFKMVYENADWMMDGAFKFSSQNNMPPYKGIDSRIEIKQVKNANNGETLLEYRMYDMSGTTPHFAFKCKPEAPVELNVSGRRITTEAKGVGQTGGNGGNIKIIVDPSVTVPYALTTNVDGAEGQRGEAGNGNRGKDGTVTTVKQKVSF